MELGDTNIKRKSWATLVKHKVQFTQPLNAAKKRRKPRRRRIICPHCKRPY